MTDEQFFSWIGILAAILTSGGLVPQAVKGYRTKCLADVSGWMLIILIAGTLLWFIYGFHKHDCIIMTANIVTCSVAVFIMTLKLVYQQKK